MPDGNSGGEGGGGGLPFQTVIVVDAGSSGCRLNVYHVNEEVRSFGFLFCALFVEDKRKGRRCEWLKNVVYLALLMAAIDWSAPNLCRRGMPCPLFVGCTSAIAYT